MQIVRVAKDFSPVPAGRFRADGPYSGERFREEILRPLLSNGRPTLVDLDEAEGYGSSFLEEAFGGLVRNKYFTKDHLLKTLKIKCEDATYIDEVWSYIEDAAHALAH